jgi:hypothetical protein
MALENTGYVHTAHKMRWKLSCTSQPPAHCMTILEIHISLRLHRSTKNLKTNPIMINSHIYSVKYLSVPSQQHDVWPVATRKGKLVKNKHHCKYNPFVYLFSILYFNYLHIVTTLYTVIISHLKCLYSFGTFVSVCERERNIAWLCAD